MTINPIKVAAKAKGPLALYHRSRSITQRYGFTSAQMDQALRQYSEVLRKFGCGATFPITAVALKRHVDIIKKYMDLNIGFAVHGYTHVDYTKLESKTQLAHLQQACEIFSNVGITPMGFRSPYLSRSDNLYTILKSAGFKYVSNQPILWDNLDVGLLTTLTKTSYKRALAFYDPWLASQRPSVPRLSNQLVEIPVSLPDDEILIERLTNFNGLVEKVWRHILAQSYQRGELFTLQLHPERIELCADSLSAVLSDVRAHTPGIWCARLDEIATWWIARATATIEVIKIDDEGYHCVVRGPSGTTVLVRSVDIDVPSLPWIDGYRQVITKQFTVRSMKRPFIGLSPSTSKQLVSFLRQQGYIVEINQLSNLYACYINREDFDDTQEREILDLIERSNNPLVRLGRWPYGAQSALAITGDIDALTLWDYGLRMVGK